MSEPDQEEEELDDNTDAEEEGPLDPATFEQVKQRFLDLIRPRWIPAPEGSSCPECGAALERTVAFGMGPYSGAVRCTACPYRNSTANYLGSKIIKVEPLPDGALPIYDRDPEEPTDE